MFLLDTNVLSTMMHEPLPPSVAAWLAGTPSRFLFTAAICQAEILAGIAVLPAGRRREGLQSAARTMFEIRFITKVWPFDTSAADAYATIFESRNRAGLHVEPPDLMIAAVALSHDAGVVTRNVADFDGCGVAVINPWDE
jgi:predicted nucleic acid-binding protein